MFCPESMKADLLTLIFRDSVCPELSFSIGFPSILHSASEKEKFLSPTEMHTVISPAGCGGIMNETFFPEALNSYLAPDADTSDSKRFIDAVERAFLQEILAVFRSSSEILSPYGSNDTEILCSMWLNAMSMAFVENGVALTLLPVRKSVVPLSLLQSHLKSFGFSAVTAGYAAETYISPVSGEKPRSLQN